MEASAHAALLALAATPCRHKMSMSVYNSVAVTSWQVVADIKDDEHWMLVALHIVDGRHTCSMASAATPAGTDRP